MSESSFIAAVRQMPKGTTQRLLEFVEQHVPTEPSKRVVRGMERIGDQALGLGTALEATGLGDFSKSAPVFGQTTSFARKGKQYRMDLDTLAPSVHMVDPKLLARLKN